MDREDTVIPRSMAPQLSDEAGEVPDMLFLMLFSLLGLGAAGFVGFSGSVAGGAEVGRYAFFGFAILFTACLIALMMRGARPHAG